MCYYFQIMIRINNLQKVPFVHFIKGFEQKLFMTSFFSIKRWTKETLKIINPKGVRLSKMKCHDLRNNNKLDSQYF